MGVQMKAVCLLAAAGAAAGAGMNTHTMVGHRAQQYYGKVSTAVPRSDLHNKAITQFIDAVHAGSDFPDFLYACGSYKNHHDAGEAAHWPPWQAAAVSYVRSLPDFKSGNWTEDTQKLVAFLYGVSVHYISDELWEGLNPQLGRGQGFVRFLSSFNLGHDGMSDNDESVANMASDFYVSWGFKETAIEPWKRYFPIDEIAEIYHRFKDTCGQDNCQDFSDVTKTSLTECKLLFDLGLWAEKEFGQILFHTYAEFSNKVPMVAERLADMPIGGIDDMAVWAAWVWERVGRWLEKGAPAHTPPNKALFSSERPESKKPDEADVWLRDWVRSLEPLRPLAAEMLALSGNDILARSEGGLSYSGPSHLRGAVQSLLRGMGEKLVRFVSPEKADSLRAAVRLVSSPPLPAPEQKTGRQGSGSVLLQGKSAVGYLGRSLASGDFDGDGKVDVAVGAHGNGEKGKAQVGEVQLLYGKGGSPVVISGPEPHARFGWEVEVVDLNADGIDDLAVAAPTASAWNTTQVVPDDQYPEMRVWGRVLVFYGRNGSGLPSSPDLTFHTEDPLTALGLTLSTGDLNQDGKTDLLVGAPMSSFKVDPSWPDSDSIQRGAVFALFSKPGRGGGRVEARKEADLVIEGPAGYEWFGQGLAVLRRQGKAPVLVVGAPGFRNESGVTVGRVYFYENKTLKGTLTGTEALAEFGHAVASRSAGDFLAVSSPAAMGNDKNQRGGEVRLYSAAVLAPVLEGNGSDVKGLSTEAILVGGGGGAAYGRLGFSLGFVKDALVVGAPLEDATTGGTVLVQVRERGAVYVWPAGALPKGRITDVIHGAAWQAMGLSTRGRLGSSFTFCGPNTLCVGVPQADDGDNEMAGAVELFKNVTL
eukprot:Hpha_TRINITY_DN15571_c2_g14::TRINITY_DN15571_c2_g14_i1::g.106278::m.106278/K01127/E3.1.4.50; glycosylphosphatidylinositol phospholipase D